MEKKEDKKKRLKSAYSLFSNYRFVYSNMWKYDKSLIGYGLAEVIFNVLIPLGSVIIPSAVVGLLELGAAIPLFIEKIAVIFIVYGIIAGIHSFLVSRNRMQYINIRCAKFTQILYFKCLNMDYHLYENEKIREDAQKAMDCLDGNNWGMEGFMHRNVSLFSNILGVIVYACIISFVHPVILLLLLMISVIQLLVFDRAKRYEHSKKDEMSKIKITQKYLQEQSYDLKAGKDIRIYQLNKLIDRVYTNANRLNKKLKSKIRGIYYINDVVGIVLQFLRDAVCYGYLIYLLFHGLEVSYFVLFIGIIRGFATWFTKITEDSAEINRSLLMISDYRKFIEMKDVLIHDQGKVIEGKDEGLDIVFEHVTYRYPGAERNVLNDVSFHIRKGEKFALVGINGAGKTTIVKLMCGFYQPTNGRILINGTDIKEFNIDKYFEKIAVIFQDAFVISFTIGENISGLPAEKIDRKKINQVLEQSGFNGKIDSLPKGIDTYLFKDLDENGIQLSGGEQQKLMLSRALYKDAGLLILDEPTAALDAIAESEMYGQYQRLLKGRTSLFISHRLASTRFCDKILFLEDGKIIEEGAHEELMNLHGKYAEMFEVQSRYYREDRKYETQEIMA